MVAKSDRGTAQLETSVVTENQVRSIKTRSRTVVALGWKEQRSHYKVVCVCFIQL